jgi:hypothetical protein
VGLGFKLRASHLQSRCSTTWAMLPLHFARVIFEIVSQTICLGWPSTLILWILASQVAHTGMSHQYPVSLLLNSKLISFSNIKSASILTMWEKMQLFYQGEKNKIVKKSTLLMSYVLKTIFSFLFWVRILLCSAGWLELIINLPQAPRWWNYRCVPPCPSMCKQWQKCWLNCPIIFFNK